MLHVCGLREGGLQSDQTRLCVIVRLTGVLHNLLGGYRVFVFIASVLSKAVHNMVALVSVVFKSHTAKIITNFEHAWKVVTLII